MKGFIVAAAGVIATLLCQSCAEIQFGSIQAGDDNKGWYLESLEDFPSAAEGRAARDSLRKILAIVEVVDTATLRKLDTLDAFLFPEEATKALEELKSRKDFETRPDTPDTNEWWGEMLKRIEHCDQRYHPGCDRYHFWDMRARAVLINGVPAEEVDDEDSICFHRIEIKSPCAVSPAAGPCPTCYVHYLRWNDETKLGFEGETADGIPEWTRPHPEHIYRDQERQEAKNYWRRDEKFVPYPEVKKEVEASLALTSFQEADGSFTVWLSAGVPPRQFNTDSSGLAGFSTQQIIYAAKKPPRVVARDSGSVTLRLADFPENSLFSLASSHRLEPGGYDLTFSIRERERPDHLGVFRATFTLPSLLTTSGMSEILLMTGRPKEMSAGGRSRGDIVRGNQTLRANPYPLYHHGDSLFFYAEFDLGEFRRDQQGTREYELAAYLIPLKGVTGSIGTVKVLPPFAYTKESTDSTATENLKTLLKEKTLFKDQYLIFSTAAATDSPEEAFAGAAIIRREILSGRFLFVVRVEDALGRGTHYLTSAREIAVKK
jgi:hypothetical protein